MLKPLFRFLILFVVVALLSFAAATTSFIITKNVLMRNQQDGAPKTNAPINADYVAAQAPAPKAEEIEFYIVRLEGDNLNVYASNGENEEFLYNTTIYINNLSAEDMSLLSSGVTLKNSSQLTGFMEDYTS